MKLHSLLVLLALALSQVLTAQVNYQEVKSAAENGDIESMNTLGVIYFSGELVSQDYAKAKYWFEKAADNGVAYAMNNLGYMYKEGVGVTKDVTIAFQWYEKAVAKEDVTAMVELGYMYYYGEGHTQDYLKA